MHNSSNGVHLFYLTYVLAGAIARLWADTCSALAELPLWQRGVHIFWLSGPLILLIERSPADLWLSLISNLVRALCTPVEVRHSPVALDSKFAL